MNHSSFLPQSLSGIFEQHFQGCHAQASNCSISVICVPECYWAIKSDLRVCRFTGPWKLTCFTPMISLSAHGQCLLFHDGLAPISCNATTWQFTYLNAWIRQVQCYFSNNTIFSMHWWYKKLSAMIMMTFKIPCFKIAIMLYMLVSITYPTHILFAWI